jgi:hypothetical protein
MRILPTTNRHSGILKISRKYVEWTGGPSGQWEPMEEFRRGLEAVCAPGQLSTSSVTVVGIYCLNVLNTYGRIGTQIRTGGIDLNESHINI